MAWTRPRGAGRLLAGRGGHQAGDWPPVDRATHRHPKAVDILPSWAQHPQPRIITDIS